LQGYLATLIVTVHFTHSFGLVPRALDLGLAPVRGYAEGLIRENVLPEGKHQEFLEWVVPAHNRGSRNLNEPLMFPGAPEGVWR
jgi:hypothetical protein